MWITETNIWTTTTLSITQESESLRQIEIESLYIWKETKYINQRFLKKVTTLKLAKD